MAQKVFNLIILDASGSMHSIRQQAIDGVNETIQTIKTEQGKNPDMLQLVTFVSFNSAMTNIVYDRVLANKVTELRSQDYTPNCGTPLYDAVGTAVMNLRDYVDEDDTVLVTVITDGYENASREFNGQAIYKLIGEMREKGWIFTYIGANQDVEKVAQSLNINNRMAFCASEEGTKEMFAKEKESRSRFYDRLKKFKSGSMTKEEFNKSSFFDEF